MKFKYFKVKYDHLVPWVGQENCVILKIIVIFIESEMEWKHLVQVSFLFIRSKENNKSGLNFFVIS